MTRPHLPALTLAALLVATWLAHPTSIIGGTPVSASESSGAEVDSEGRDGQQLESTREVEESASPRRENNAAGGSREAALREIEEWIEEHPEGLEVSIDAEADGSSGRLRPVAGSQPCELDPDGVIELEYEAEDGLRVQIGVACTALDSVEPAALEDGLQHVEILSLPHDLQLSSWRFDVDAPEPATTRGVDLRPASDGRLFVGIQTPLYSVRGVSLDRSCQTAGTDLPPACVVAREHRVPLRVRMRVPIQRNAIERLVR